MNLIPEWHRRESVLAIHATAILLLVVPLVAAAFLDPRTFNGVDLWLKPIKFHLALGIYLGTLAWFAAWASPALRDGRTFRVYRSVVLVCIYAELVWIDLAAAGGLASHFNREVPLLVMLYPLMGVAAVVLTSMSLVLGVSVLRNRRTALPAPMRLAIGLGLVLTFLLTVPAAGILSSHAGHLVGGDGSDKGGLALFGWARDGGDLRVAHFFATHAMHVIPLFGLAFAWSGRERLARGSVVALSTLFVAFVAFTCVQALAGRPFLPWLG